MHCERIALPTELYPQDVYTIAANRQLFNTYFFNIINMMKINGKKPEYMTNLYGNVLVPKTHGRIIFRGLVDTLQAEIIEAQVLASGLGEKESCDKLGEILSFLRALMAAEVKEIPLPPLFLFGMDVEEIHRQSHEAVICNAEGKPALPDYTHGPLTARLNTLRARARETELFSVRVFGPEGANEAGLASKEREDIVLALNRLSSALWLLTCQSCNKP